jgi:hypothetical protein
MPSSVLCRTAADGKVERHIVSWEDIFISPPSEALIP